MIKEIPILFSTSMVQAILDKRKTMTRRIVKAEHVLYNLNVNNFIPEYYHNGDEGWCPFGKPGDLLYVREEHYRYGAWIEKEGEYTKGGRQKWMFVPHTDEVLYQPPAEFRKGCHHKDPYTAAWHKRLARFMPKTSARIWLQVTDIRVERLQGISEEDAKAEGVIVTPEQAASNANHRHYLKDKIPAGDYQLAFCNLWREIHFTSIQDQLAGKDGWNENPWVWVVSFTVLSTTGKPDLKI